MTFTLSDRSLGFIMKVDPRLTAVAKLAISLSTQDFGFTEEQSRTPAEQAKKVAHGFSKTMHTHHMINDGKGSTAWMKTQPDVGYCGALDAVAYINGAFSWASAEPYYAIAAAFKAASVKLLTPVTWGACWGKLLQDIPGDDAAAMKAAHLAAGGFSDFPHMELGAN